MTQEELALALLDIIRQGRARCGAGFGKYPLGIRDAVERFLPFVADNEQIQRELADFDRRLSE